MTKDALKTAIVAISIGGGYLLIAELAICGFDLFDPQMLTRLPPTDTIALLAGAVTAVGLSAVYMQIQEARKDAEGRAEQRAIETAQRADQLHAEFNTIEMRNHRDVAYKYLEYLNDSRHPERLEQFAKNWICEQGSCPVPDSSNGEQTITSKEFSWSISCMLAFFVRVSAHIRLHEKHLTNNALHELIGTFFWSYWSRKGLVKLVEACDTVYLKEGKGLDRPYFIDGIRRLDKYATRAREDLSAKTEAQPALPANDLHAHASHGHDSCGAGTGHG